MFRLPTPRLFSGLKSALRPAMPRFKVSAFWLLILVWFFLLVWIWWKGPTWTLYEEQWLKPLANRWLATAIWGIIALVWLTVRVMKRLQQLEKIQKQQREEAVNPLSVELNAQQRYLDRWLLHLQRHLDNRGFAAHLASQCPGRHLRQSPTLVRWPRVTFHSNYRTLLRARGTHLC